MDIDQKEWEGKAKNIKITGAIYKWEWAECVFCFVFLLHVLSNWMELFHWGLMWRLKIQNFVGWGWKKNSKNGGKLGVWFFFRIVQIPSPTFPTPISILIQSHPFLPIPQFPLCVVLLPHFGIQFTTTIELGVEKGIANGCMRSKNLRGSSRHHHRRPSIPIAPPN